ncbi:Z1 domain-containing protein [bacterium]|nr:Z1 domain-containing protein [bacterium]
MKWSPSIGQETLKLQEYFESKKIDDVSINNLTNEAIRILGKCGNPEEPTSNDTGLAFGYVQSGKTMSFTNLATLAKDNGFQIIIIIAGVTTNLVSQSTVRLEKDLQLNTRNDRKWLAIPNPKSNDDKNSIASVLKTWKDSTFLKSKRKTVLLTVMKQKNHLPNLIRLLEKIDLKGVPTLIIDDEGDQASMNTFGRINARNSKDNVSFSEEQISTIYRHMNKLKSILPHHSFVQYTATPQAPLFVHIMSSLSPNFIELLTPGEKYTGGEVFFGRDSNLVRIIPNNEIGTRQEPLSEPPESLLESLRIFFLGVAEGFPEYKFGNRSMLIHPSHLTNTHEDYYRWARNIKNSWVDILKLDDKNPDKKDLISEFKKSFDDLKTTLPSSVTFSGLINDNILFHSIRDTQIRQVNSKNKDSVNWRDFYSHILVGGFKMDRGFTVEGLTVTYMPRGRGVGNADTIQQRARFFGYKKDFLGFCRVFVDRFVNNDYENYIEHEGDMRRRLQEHIDTGLPLNRWYRQVFLDRDLRLTRPNVIYNNLERSRFGDGWFTIKAPHDNVIAYKENRDLFKTFLKTKSITYTEDEFNSKEIPLKVVLDEFLNNLKFTRMGDSKHYTALLYTIARYLESEPNETCSIYYISDFKNPRVRTLTIKDQINQLFQGGNKRTGGIRQAKANQGITIQIHVLDLRLSLTEPTLHKQVPTLAIYIPESIGKDLIGWQEN